MTGRTLLRRPQFIDDLTDAYAYLATRSPVTADRLLDEVEALASLLSNFPELGRTREALAPHLRSFRLRAFPYVVFSRLRRDDLVLLRLLHGARDIQPRLLGG